MQVQNNFFNWVFNRADLLTEPTPGDPLIEIVADRRVLIENHCGVTVYGGKEIRVKVSYGMVCVQGKRLELARMSKQQLVITGCLDSVSLLRGGCG